MNRFVAYSFTYPHFLPILRDIQVQRTLQMCGFYTQVSLGKPPYTCSVETTIANKLKRLAKMYM